MIRPSILATALTWTLIGAVVLTVAAVTLSHLLAGLKTFLRANYAWTADDLNPTLPIGAREADVYDQELDLGDVA